MLAASTVLAAAAERRPVPSVIIYPGDAIRDEQLTDQDFAEPISNVAYATNRTMLVGKVAKRTLLPGKPIPANAIGEPRLVTIGARVRVVFEDGALNITAYGAALQNGIVGDFVSVRNVESGVTVSGTVAPDGSVHVGPG